MRSHNSIKDIQLHTLSQPRLNVTRHNHKRESSNHTSTTHHSLIRPSKRYSVQPNSTYISGYSCLITPKEACAYYKLHSKSIPNKDNNYVILPLAYVFTLALTILAFLFI
jgi:hypothetical protein